MKTKFLLLPLAVSNLAFGSVILNIDTGYFLTASNQAVPVGSLAVLVVDSNGDGFAQGADLSGKTLTKGSSFGSDDLILGSLVAAGTSFGGTGALINGFNGSIDFDLTGNVGNGDRLALYFFPSITSSSASLDGTSYGFFSGVTSSAIPQGSDISFSVPVDGFSYSLNAYSPQCIIDQGGEFNALTDPTQANFTANLTVPVPEPSTYALMGLGLVVVGLIARRKKA